MTAVCSAELSHFWLEVQKKLKYEERRNLRNRTRAVVFFNGNSGSCIERKSDNTEVSKTSFIRCICASYLNENA